jgi:hypothetical protein
LDSHRFFLYLDMGSGLLTVSFFSDHGNNLIVEFISITSRYLFLVNRSYGCIAAAPALFDAVLDLDVQIRILFLEVTVNLALAFVVFAEADLHFKS